MTLDEYLGQFIELYLLQDLAAMARIKPQVGYPMVMTVVSGIEVLGALTSTATFSIKENGATRFGEYWKNYMYADRRSFHELGSVVYTWIRHPLAHSFMTKPMIVVTKDGAGCSLFRLDDRVVVDALSLAEDFAAAYTQRLKPNIVGELRRTMEARFGELRAEFWKDHAAKKHELAKVPAPSMAAALFYEASQKPMESTGVTGIFSTNVSSSGFDKPK